MATRQTDLREVYPASAAREHTEMGWLSKENVPLTKQELDEIAFEKKMKRVRRSDRGQRLTWVNYEKLYHPFMWTLTVIGVLSPIALVIIIGDWFFFMWWAVSAVILGASWDLSNQPRDKGRKDYDKSNEDYKGYY